MRVCECNIYYLAIDLFLHNEEDGSQKYIFFLIFTDKKEFVDNF